MPEKCHFLHFKPKSIKRPKIQSVFAYFLSFFVHFHHFFCILALIILKHLGAKFWNFSIWPRNAQKMPFLSILTKITKTPKNQISFCLFLSFFVYFYHFVLHISTNYTKKIGCQVLECFNLAQKCQKDDIFGRFNQNYEKGQKIQSVLAYFLSFFVYSTILFCTITTII